MSKNEGISIADDAAETPIIETQLYTELKTQFNSLTIINPIVNNNKVSVGDISVTKSIETIILSSDKTAPEGLKVSEVVAPELVSIISGDSANEPRDKLELLGVLVNNILNERKKEMPVDDKMFNRANQFIMNAFITVLEKTGNITDESKAAFKEAVLNPNALSTVFTTSPIADNVSRNSAEVEFKKKLIQKIGPEVFSRLLRNDSSEI